jgi:S-adenosylmethionine decarboxylase
LEKDFVLFAEATMTVYAEPGLHLLLDFWGATHLQNMEFIEQTMRQAAEICGATVLDVKLHSFGAGMGITGVAILAESHISIHTWPETGFLALDVFMCGKCNPHLAVPVFMAAFQPQKSQVRSYLRGVED